MSTLDHLTKGRVGWNIVTGYLNSAAKGAGMDAQSAHDLRYEIAEAYIELMYKLWEGSCHTPGPSGEGMNTAFQFS
jgi:alkanesulfonate monooxygenase SsuD/methylene tetrahydromethanopterin reductase-like flavin-dependent oxidoreductase (luciferase family)